MFLPLPVYRGGYFRTQEQRGKQKGLRHIAGCHHKLNPSCEGGLGRTDGASAAYRLDYEIEFGGGDVSLQYARFKSGSLPAG